MRAAIDRAPQALPVPIGGMAPVHARPPLPHAARARLRARATSLAGLLAGAAGCVLLTTAPGRAVYVRGGELHAGATTLRLTAQTSTSMTFSGDASYVLSIDGNGAVEARATWLESGVTAVSECVETVPAGAPTVACHRVMAGAAALTWTDVFDAAHGVWHRRYGDGARTDISVPTGTTAVPVAFPIGR